MAKKCRSYGLLAFVFLLAGAAGVAQQSQSAYQIPRTVYVGDRAMLILPLPDQVITGNFEIAPEFLSLNDIEIHRIALEGRQTGGRLIIEWTAFAPGSFELPMFEAGGLRFTGLKIEISSILKEREQPVLSGLAAPLSVPGTGVFIYSSMAVLALALLAAIWASVWGRRYFPRWFSARKRRRLISIMAHIEKRMRIALSTGNDVQFILDTISAEFRKFLSLWTGEDCLAMTSAEFGQFRLQAGLSAEQTSGFLKRFFGDCDKLRFCGAEVNGPDVQALLADLHNFLISLYKTISENSPGIKQAGQNEF